MPNPPSTMHATIDSSYAPQAIGVFDSGVGGLSVLRHIHAALPDESLIYVADSLHAPYGNKTPMQIQARCVAIAEFLIQKNVKALVVACNTATAAAVAMLRRRYSVPIIGMEPAVKPAAAATKTGVIGVLATVGTLQSAQFAALLASYGQEVRVVTQGCAGLVECIERGELASESTRALIREYCEPLLAAGADTIVLGCTHYPFVKPLIAEVASAHVTLIETGPAVAKQLQHRLAAQGLLASQQLHAKTSQSLPSAMAQLTMYTNSPNPQAHQVITQLWHAGSKDDYELDIQAF